jgi:hypothetical protein
MTHLQHEQRSRNSSRLGVDSIAEVKRPAVRSLPPLVPRSQRSRQRPTAGRGAAMIQANGHSAYRAPLTEGEKARWHSALMQWVQDGLLEEPEFINGRAYFRTDASPRGARATKAAA